MDVIVKKFHTDSGCDYYTFFPKGSISNIDETGIQHPLFILTDLEFDELFRQMKIQREVRV